MTWSRAEALGLRMLMWEGRRTAQAVFVREGKVCGWKGAPLMFFFF